MVDEPIAAAPEPTAAPGAVPIPAPEPTPTPEPTPPVDIAWRDTLKSDDAKKFAETSPDVDHLVGRALTLQKQVSSAVILPGKDAEPAEVAAYHKRIGVPETAEGYVFAMPEGHEASEADKAFQSIMAKTMHAAAVPAEAAAQLNAAFNEFTNGVMEEQVAADKKFAEASEVELRKHWPGEEYDTNKNLVNRFIAKQIGEDGLTELKTLEMKDGRYAADHPLVLRALAGAARLTAESGEQAQLGAAQLEQAQDEVTDLRARSSKALAEGNTREANRLYQKEQELLGKIGPAPVAA